jgi:hypothetical protein
MEELVLVPLNIVDLFVWSPIWLTITAKCCFSFKKVTRTHEPRSQTLHENLPTEISQFISILRILSIVNVSIDLTDPRHIET